MPNDSPRVLVFQHISTEHPGIFRDFMREDGIEWTPIEIDEGESIPDLEPFDALMVMGGPQDVWEVDKYPWLDGEKAVIREAVVEREMPFIGFCLGHQLLADALGGAVDRAQTPEVGVLEVELTEDGQRSTFYTDMPRRERYLQWHGAEVTRAPDDATVLAVSEACRFQAISVGDHALGLQYHIELTPTTVHDWAEIPTYKKALEKALGPGGLEIMKSGTDARMDGFNREARQLYDNFMRRVR
ncbi:MAG: type 1 glutamine amidotransferase [Alphaproteobacteria bacterium]|nr:type 1 glutamine amidotransferase [Alphaproteobacteria bacterium]